MLRIIVSKISSRFQPFSRKDKRIVKLKIESVCYFFREEKKDHLNLSVEFEKQPTRSSVSSFVRLRCCNKEL